MHSMNGIQTIQKYAILFQSADFPNDTKKSLKSRENLANPGKTWQRKVRKNYAKSIIHLPRQHTNRADSSEIKESAPFLWKMCQVK